MKKEDINLEVRDGAVTLSGDRKVDEPAAGVEYHRAERVGEKFSRSFSLPQTIKQEDIRATYRDGILEILVLWLYRFMFLVHLFTSVYDSQLSSGLMRTLPVKYCRSLSFAVAYLFVADEENVTVAAACD